LKKPEYQSGATRPEVIVGKGCAERRVPWISHVLALPGSLVPAPGKKAVARQQTPEEAEPMPLDLEVNRKRVTVDVDPTTPLLWVLRETLRLTGTKYGCGMAQCGACTVHLDGHAVRSCVLPVSAAAGKSVMTIEGLTGAAATALAQAWIEVDVPQCGYCQPGQIMSAAVLLSEKAAPTDGDIDACMAGNVCRCATYVRIRSAIHRAAELAGGRR
jgi:aerobic-type carbon monoxide dehydrogenase small subunit (CoxS/CutS family)